MNSGISRHVALPFLAFSGLTCFGLVRLSFSLSKTRSVCSLLKILHSRVFLLFNKPDVVDDRISQLPDDILFSVISRLSIIDAVRTSILSRTWKNLYTFIDHANFDYVEMYLLDSCDKPRAAKLFQEDPSFKYYPDSKRSFYPVPTTFNREEFVEAVNTFFQHFSGSKRRLTFTSVPSLERLSITLYDNRVGPSVFRQLIEDLPPVKSLYYENSGRDPQVYEKCELNNTILGSLRELFFIVTKPESVLNITTILDACPLLQKFHLVLQTTESALFFGQKIEMSLEPHSQLEEVELSGFSGTWIEIFFSLYILKNVVTLKRMRIIRCSKRYVGYGRWDWMENVETRFSEKKRRRIHKQLQGQVLSKSAQVIIHG